MNVKKRVKVQYCHKTVLLIELQFGSQWPDTPRNINNMAVMVEWYTNVYHHVSLFFQLKKSDSTFTTTGPPAHVTVSLINKVMESLMSLLGFYM